MPSETAPAPTASRHIEADAARLRREVPALSSVIDCFVPVLAAQAGVREEAPGWTGPLPARDEARLCAGEFLLSGSGFQDIAPCLPLAAARILPVMAASFPALARQLTALQAALRGPDAPLAAVAAAAFSPDRAAVPGVSPEVLGFAARQMAKPLLERQARDLAPLVQDIPWRRTFCPVCGDAPAFTRMLRVQDEAEYITGHGGHRFLRCATCETEWRYKRISCPKCGNEEPARLSVMHAEGRPFERLDVCEACNTYCLCLDCAEFIAIPDPAIAALAMLPLEMRAREQGYAPLVAQPWSASLERPAA